MSNVKTKSGMSGWQGRLRAQYDDDFEAFAYYDELYGLSARLGYDNVQEAWDGDPIVQGSVIPSDYCRVS